MRNKVILLLVLLLGCGISLSAQANRSFQKGYQGSVEVGNYAVFGKDKYGGMVQLTTTHGFRMGNGVYLAAGGGVAYDYRTNDYIIPLFLDAKYNFIDASASPFVDLRTGIRFNGSVNQALGSFISFACGIDSGRFSVKIGYEYGVTRQHVAQYNGTNWIGEDTLFLKPSQLFCSFAVNF